MTHATKNAIYYSVSKAYNEKEFASTRTQARIIGNHKIVKRFVRVERAVRIRSRKRNMEFSIYLCKFFPQSIARYPAPAVPPFAITASYHL